MDAKTNGGRSSRPYVYIDPVDGDSFVTPGMTKREEIATAITAQIAGRTGCAVDRDVKRRQIQHAIEYADILIEELHREC